MDKMIFCIITAYILDLILGDPRWFPNPVKYIGLLIKKLENPIRKIFSNEKINGIIFAITIIFISILPIWLFVKMVSSLNEMFGILLSVGIMYTTLSVKDLKVESLEVYDALKKKDKDTARTKLSMIVGRDTENLEEKEIVRATVETVAESTVDGILSPLFYGFIGGPILALTYKAINTLDSMVGYKNEKYKYFGWASAKLDDWANFIPARLSAVIFPFAAWLSGKDGLTCWRIILRDRKKNPSPNSGIPEAAIAGTLGIQLGGLNFYNSTPTLKPFISDNINPLEEKHIREAIKIAYLCSALAVIVGVITSWTVKYLMK